MNRQVQIRTENNEWVDIDIKDLKESDVFRFLNSRGEVAVDSKGRSTYTAAGTPYEKFGDMLINVY